MWYKFTQCSNYIAKLCRCTYLNFNSVKVLWTGCLFFLIFFAVPHAEMCEVNGKRGLLRHSLCARVQKAIFLKNGRQKKVATFQLLQWLMYRRTLSGKAKLLLRYAAMAIMSELSTLFNCIGIVRWCYDEFVREDRVWRMICIFVM